MQNGASGCSFVTWALPIDLKGPLCKLISSADTGAKKADFCLFSYCTQLPKHTQTFNGT